MEGFNHLLNGFINSLTLVNLVACFIGALVGTIVGVLPGLGPTVTMALMLPFTLKYGPATGLIMMTGVWYGAMYGGSTTSILVNIPGEAASVMTCLDGYQMCKKGRAGAALALVASGPSSPERWEFWAFSFLPRSWETPPYPSALRNILPS